EILSHPPYFPDIARSDYHLCRALQRFSVGKKFDNIDSVRSNVEKYFNAKPKKFYSEGIMASSKRLQAVVERKGGYILSEYLKVRLKY
ncbi:Histone-lysine N-methyltransferase SETMAR, partial [Habropoda laboriosa]